MRVMTSSWPPVRSGLGGFISLSLLNVSQIVTQAIEPRIPEPAVILEPVCNLAQWVRLEPARTPLRRAAARDQSGALQHLEMLRNPRKAHVERLGQLGDR